MSSALCFYKTRPHRDPFAPEDPSLKKLDLSKEMGLEAALADAMGVPYTPEFDMRAFKEEVKLAAAEKARPLKDRVSAAFDAIRNLDDPQEQARRVDQLIVDSDRYFAERRKRQEARTEALFESLKEELAALDAPIEAEMAREDRELTTYLIEDVATVATTKTTHRVFIIINGNLFKTPFDFPDDAGNSPKWSLRSQDGIKILKVSSLEHDRTYQLLPAPGERNLSRGSLVKYAFEHIPLPKNCTRIGENISFRRALRRREQHKMAFSESADMAQWGLQDRVVMVELYSKEQGVSLILLNVNHNTFIPCTLPQIEETFEEDDFVVIG